MYGLCIIAGALACVITAGKLLKNAGKFEILVYGTFAFFGAMAGGYLLFGIVNIGDFDKGLLYMFRGSVFYGGFLGALFMTGLYTKKSPVIPKENAFDTLAVCTPLFHFFGRIGCSFAGCCFGIVMKSGESFPVQLTEAFCNLAIFTLMIAFYVSGKYKGKLIFGYIMLYAPLRFFLEFLRGDAERGVYILSVSQWISLALIGAVMLLFWRKNKNIDLKMKLW